jgi:hypothetical protein
VKDSVYEDQIAGVAVLLVLVAIGVWYLRRPQGSGRVGRDVFAMKAKAEDKRVFGTTPSDAFDRTIRDDAADLPPGPERNRH